MFHFSLCICVIHWSKPHSCLIIFLASYSSWRFEWFECITKCIQNNVTNLIPKRIMHADNNNKVALEPQSDQCVRFQGCPKTNGRCQHVRVCGGVFVHSLGRSVFVSHFELGSRVLRCLTMSFLNFNRLPVLWLAVTCTTFLLLTLLTRPGTAFPALMACWCYLASNYYRN